MKMNFLAFFVLFLLIYFIGTGAYTEQQDPLQASKTRLIKKLEANILETQKSIDELHALISKYGGPNPPAQDKHDLEFSVDTPHHLESATYNLKRYRELLELIKKEDARRIPALLATAYFPCDRRNCPFMGGEDLIIAFGASALPPLLDHFKSLDGYGKNSVLMLLLQIKPVQCPTGVLDAALAEPLFDMRVDSLRIYKNNCSSDVFRQKLNRLFASETDLKFLLHVMEQISKEDWGVPQNYNRLIQLTQQERIPLNVALGQLCSITLPIPELDVDALDIPFWLNLVETKKIGQGCLINYLFLNLNQEKHLLKLQGLFREAVEHHDRFNSIMHDLFREAIEHHYRFNSIRDWYGFISPSHSSYWDGYQVDEKFLALFQKHLSAEVLNTWRRAPDTAFGEKLLLSQWLGEDLFKIIPHKFRLQIEVRNPANALVSVGAQDVTLGQPYDFTLAPLVSDFREIRYQGTLGFNHGKLSYTINDYTLGYEVSGEPSGSGFGFPILVPVAGHFETALTFQEKKY